MNDEKFLRKARKSFDKVVKSEELTREIDYINRLMVKHQCNYNKADNIAVEEGLEAMNKPNAKDHPMYPRLMRERREDNE